jgi:hypothetical protein
MHKIAPYTGKRNPCFVTVKRGGALEERQHRLLVAWAAACAEHVVQYFYAQSPEDDRPQQAIESARAWSRNEISVIQAREAAYAAHEAARAVTGAAKEAARAAGHAAATAHMADHELGAAAYAIRAVRAAALCEQRDIAGKIECQWQRKRLPEAIRALVIEDEDRRNKKFWNLFICLSTK